MWTLLDLCVGLDDLQPSRKLLPLFIYDPCERMARSHEHAPILAAVVVAQEGAGYVVTSVIYHFRLAGGKYVRDHNR